MPRFFFEMTVNRQVFEDDEGYEFPDAEHARSDALKTLSETSRSAPPDGEVHRYRISVRDETRKLIFEAETFVRFRWVM